LFAANISKRVTFVLLVIAALHAALAHGALRTVPPERHHWPIGVKPPKNEEPLRRLIVKFKDDVEPSVAHQYPPSGHVRALSLNGRANKPQGVKWSHLKSISAQSHVLVSDVPMSRVEMAALARNIAQDPRVAYAEIDERVYPLSASDNPLYDPKQWNMKAPADAVGGANLTDAWNQSTQGQTLNGAGVTVAILDTGYRPHVDVLANTVGGYDFVSIDSDGSFTTANDGNGRDADALDPGDWNPISSPACDGEDSTWHGTRVAGIIGAISNTQGVIGVAYGARLLPVRVLGRCGGYTSDIAAGIQWAAGLSVPGVPTNPYVAKVINLSIGSSQACAATFQNAINAARSAGSVIVVATGNDSPVGTISSPANCSGVIAVTAHTRLGDSASYANIGTRTDLSAPGGGDGRNHISGDIDYIYSTSNTGTTVPLNDTYAGGSGTSFAAPHVSGVAALLFQIRPTISPDAVLHYLTSAARAFPAGSYCAGRNDCGAGMLDATAAVQALINAQIAANSAPVMATIAPQTVAAGGSLQFPATATDADGDRVSFTLSGLPSGANFDGNSGVFQWAYALPGTYSVTLTPYDGLTSGAPQVVRITVTGSLPPSGGGGAVTWGELLATVLLFMACSMLRRPVATKNPPQRNGQQATPGTRTMRRVIHRNWPHRHR